MAQGAPARRRIWLAALALIVAAVMVLLLWPRARRQPTPPAADTAAAASDAGPAPRVRASTLEQLTGRNRRARLTGIVIDHTGRPAPRVAVQLTGPAAAETRTNERGGFFFDDLLLDTYVLEAFGETQSSGAVRVHLEERMPLVVLRLGPAAQLLIHVVAAATERPIPEAHVELRAVSMQQRHITIRKGQADRAGTIAFRGVSPGSYAVGAWAPGFRGGDFLFQTTAGLKWEYTAKLQQGAEVRGRVVDDQGAPVADAVIAHFPTEKFIGALVSRPRPWGFTTRSGPDGTFAMSALEAGNWRLFATHPDYQMGWSDPISVDGKTPYAGVVIKVASGGEIRGRVVTAGGLSVARATVRVVPADFQRHGIEVRTAVGDAEGRFALKGLPRAVMELVAAVDGATSETVKLDLAEQPKVLDLTVPLVHDGEISGVVVNPDGRPIQFAMVTCVGDRRGELGLRSPIPETTDGEGRFACRGLAPGNYHVVAVLPYPNNNVHPGMRGTGAFANVGEKNLQLVVPGDGALKGRVQLANGSAPRRFSIQLVQGMQPQPIDKPDGTFFLDGLPPGPLTVTVIVPGLAPATKEVQVAEGGTTDIGTIVVSEAPASAPADDDGYAPPGPPPDNMPPPTEHFPGPPASTGPPKEAEAPKH